jgi:hypothetical protein
VPVASRRKPRWALIALLVATAPVGLALESGLRTLLFPPELDEVRAAFAPSLTPIAWGFAALTAAALPLGILAKRAFARRALARFGEGATKAQRDRVGFEALLVGTSVSQLPALLGGLLVMFGAALTPVLVAIAVATLAILLQGFEREA